MVLVTARARAAETMRVGANVEPRPVRESSGRPSGGS
jgi:hypothetical protein